METIQFEVFNDYCYYMILWLTFFCILTFCNIIVKNLSNHKTDNKLKSKKDNLILEELSGLPFMLLHSICWYVSRTWLDKLLFMYWGPLYIVTAYLVLFHKNINWKPIAISSSIMCKSFYVGFVSIFWYLNMMLPIYCYSVWIMHDQVKLAWFKNNGDRTRRLFEDWFVFRIGYPLFLLLPFFNNEFFMQKTCMVLSGGLLTMWILGIARLVKNGTFFDKPKIEGFGRDIVYL